MLHIITQYRKLFMGFIVNSFAEKSDFKADEFINADEVKRDNILKNNSKEIIAYIESLDKVKDNNLVSNFSKKEIDDFSWTNLTENLRNENVLKSILGKLWLDKNQLSQWISIKEIVSAINRYSWESKSIIDTTKKETKEIFLPKWFSKQLDHQTESWYDMFMDNHDGVFVLRIDDLWMNDSIKLFKRYPTESEIKLALSNYEKWGEESEKSGWWDEDEFGDLKNKLLNIKDAWKNKANIDKKPDIAIKTPEVSWTIETTFWSTENLADYKNNINFSSFEWMITKMSYSELFVFVRQIQQIAWENNYDKETNTLKYNLFNTWKLEDLFKSKGYESDWVFGPGEVASLFRLFGDTFETQKEFSNGKLDYKWSIKILLDYNFDWLLDNENIEFYTKEKEFLLAVKSEKDFTNLLSSLWYKSYDDFKSKMANNYFNERKEFKNKLATVLDNDLNINPVEMLISKDAVKNKVETLKRIQDEFEKNPKFKAIEAKDKRLADLIKYQWAWAILGSMNGWAVSFDISNLTYNFIDSLSFGIVNGTLWFVIDKRLYSDGTFTLDVWAANFIPYIAWSAQVYKSTMDDFKDIFPKKVDSGVKVTLWGTVFLTWSWWAWLDLTKVDEHTKEWIEGMKEKMWESLDKIFDFIKNGKDFSETWIDNTKENKEWYDRLKWLYKSFWEAWVSFLKQWALNNYERELYKNAEWLNFAWISVWVISAFGYLMPVIWAHAEFHSTEWNQTQEAWENTYKVETKSKINDYSKTVEWIQSSNVELNQAVKNLDSTITYRTRTNKFADVIMNPNSSLDVRWKWFEDFANRQWKFSKELQGTINAFKSVIDSAKKENITTDTKLYILSTVVQMMKKSNDTNSWNIENYNSNYEKLIAMKNKRRWWYNELFGFNIDEESKSFDQKLIKAWEKKSISERTYSGISFDAAASKQVWAKRETMKWIDVFLSNVQILTDWNEPILSPIIDKSKINAFVNTLNWLTNLDNATKKGIIDWIKSWDLVLNYYSDPDWFDDRIILLSRWWKEIFNSEEREWISVFKPSFDTDNYGVLFGMDVKSHGKPETKSEEKPKGDWTSSKPGENNNGSTTTNWWTSNVWQAWWNKPTWGFKH